MDRASEPTVLVPVDVSEPGALEESLVDLLSAVPVVLLGYYPVPDQVAPEQLRDEYEDEATQALERVVSQFAAAGDEPDAVVVFTRNRDDSIDRLAAEYACDVVLSPGEFERIDRVLVALRGDPNLDRIVTVTADLFKDGEALVTLYNAVEPGADRTQGEFILRGAADRLRELGVDVDRIVWEQSETDSPAAEIVRLAEDHDVVVIGETDPSLRERILGDVPARIIDRTGRPVLVVRDVG